MEGRITFMGTWWRLEPDERYDPKCQRHSISEILTYWARYKSIPKHIYLCIDGQPMWEVPFEPLEKNV